MEPASSVLVTGANRGIGREVARQMAARGYHVFLAARTEEKAVEAARSLGDRVHATILDVTSRRSVDAAAAWLEREHGRLDVLINNAGVHYDVWQRAADADIDGTVTEALQVNLLGAWRVTRALLPLLRRSRRGRIVNVSSEAGSLATMGIGPPGYQVSKAALNALTRTLAAELKADGILVNAICPGWTATEMGGTGGRPVAEGAASIVWGATLPDDGPTGGFFRDGVALSW